MADWNTDESEDVGLAEGRNKKRAETLKRRRYSLKFRPIKYMIDEISRDSDEILRYIETYLNSRPPSAENLKLAKLINYVHNLDEDLQENVNFEELIEKFELDAPHLIGAIAGGLANEKITLTKLIAVKEAPEIVRAIADRAKSPTIGTADSKLMMEMIGQVEGGGTKINIGKIIAGDDNSQSNTQINNGLPEYLGNIYAKENKFRDSYRKALSAGEGTGDESIIDLTPEREKIPIISNLT